MGFQSTVSLSQGYGVQGEVVYDGPVRGAGWELVSSPATNVIGARAYTVVTPATDNAAGVAIAGGTGAFCGILAAPKSYANFSGTLAASLTLPDNTIGELLTMAQMLVLLATAASPGDLVVYNTTTGALSSIVPSFAATASFATSVMTIIGTPTGIVGVGQTVSFASVDDGTRIVSLGTGTGGAGTYNLSSTPGTVGSAAGTIYAGTNAGSGKLFVPRTKVILRASGAAALAIIAMTSE